MLHQEFANIPMIFVRHFMASTWGRCLVLQLTQRRTYQISNIFSLMWVWFSWVCYNIRWICLCITLMISDYLEKLDNFVTTNKQHKIWLIMYFILSKFCPSYLNDLLVCINLFVLCIIYVFARCIIHVGAWNYL